MRFSPIFTFLFLTLYGFSANAAEEIILLANGVDDEYNRQALSLALEETIDTHGPYRITLSEVMSDSRAARTLLTKKYTNAVRIGIPGMTLIDLEYATFPVQLGGLGLQVCFKSKDNPRLNKTINSIDDIKAFTFAAPRNWSDDDIFIENGFKTEPGFNSSLKRTILHLFQMARQQKVDYACRPVTTVAQELEEFPISQTLEIEERFALWLEKPLFFGSVDNKALINRIYTGLVSAFQNGKYKAFWEKHYLQSFQLSNIKEKEIFYLPSSAVSQYKQQYHQFLYFLPTTNKSSEKPH